MSLRDASWTFIAGSIILLLVSEAAVAQRLVMLLSRDTGSTEVFNASGGGVSVDSYSITSASGLLNVDGWNSLTDQGVAGFAEANPRSVGLSELAFPPASATIGSGDTVNLGNSYVGGRLTPKEEDVEFRFTVPEGGVVDGIVKYTGRSPVPTITVDRVTGNMDLTNPGGFAIDGYTIASPSGLLNAAGFTGLASQNVAGWTQVQPSALFITELNLEGSQSFDPNTTLGLGAAYNAAAGVPLSDEDLTFEYTTSEGIREGVVNFSGPVNDLVLQVDSLSGEARIQNLSPIAGPFEIVGYDIMSPSGSLAVDAWNSFTDSGNAGAGWSKANPRSERLAELNLTSTTVFETGTSISLGNIVSGPEDLVFEYATMDGVLAGSVEYVINLGATIPGDCNNDGVVNASDLACVGDLPERDAVLNALNTLPGDLNGNGDVAFGDFLILSTNFNAAGLGYAQGNIDLVDTVGFPDFLVMSTNFGKTPGGVAAAVPEPTGIAIAVAGLLVCCICTRKGNAVKHFSPAYFHV